MARVARLAIARFVFSGVHFEVDCWINRWIRLPCAGLDIGGDASIPAGNR